MTLAWDGRPENAERDGLFWLCEKPGSHPLIPCRWEVAGQVWHFLGYSSVFTANQVSRWYTYHGPVTPPAEVAKLRAHIRELEKLVIGLTEEITP